MAVPAKLLTTRLSPRSWQSGVRCLLVHLAHPATPQSRCLQGSAPFHRLSVLLPHPCLERVMHFKPGEPSLSTRIRLWPSRKATKFSKSIPRYGAPDSMKIGVTLVSATWAAAQEAGLDVLPVP